MNILTEVQNNLIRTSKGKLIVNPAFDVVLEIQNLYRESELTDFEKINCALKMLVKNDWNLKKYTPTEKISLLEEIYKKCINVKKRPQTKKSALPVLDFEEDGDYIYASFMQEYGIDLIDQQGKLPWRKFLWLFNGLGADTKIKQVMHIREMEIPQFNGKNQKQIQEIQELKSYYALPVKGGGGQSGLDLLFSTLEGMAKH